MKGDLVVRQLDERYHCEDNFKEQIALLYPIEINDKKREVTLMRTFAYVCDAGQASLDPDHPGLDTFAAWEEMDAFIDDHGACGFFHTHPPGCYHWSDQDIRTQNGLAKANGNKFLWHGVQAASGGGITVFGSDFVCCWMERGRVFRYVYPPMFEDHLECPIIRLSMPPVIKWHDNAYSMSAPGVPHCMTISG